MVGGDLNYVKSVTTGDFSMVHGDLWTRGGKANLRDTQDSMLSRVGKSYGVLDFDHIRVEMHGDIAITDGRYLARSNGANPDRAWFSVWFERVRMPNRVVAGSISHIVRSMDRFTALAGNP